MSPSPIGQDGTHLNPAGDAVASPSAAVRLLFVSHSFPPADRPLTNVGGMQRVATELHGALARHPEVELSTLVLRCSWRWTHVRTALFLPRAIWTIRRLARRREIEAVLFSSLVTGSLVLLLQRKLRQLGVRTLAIAHGDDVILPVGLYQRVLPKVLGALDAVLPVSRATAQACIGRGAPAERVHVIPNGVDPERFSPLPPEAPPRRELLGRLGLLDSCALPDDALLLCSTGRQVARKGFAWFVGQVMPLLPANVHYWLVGRGPETEKIRDAIARHGLDQRVRLLGSLSDPDLQAVYRSADLYVMPNLPVKDTMEGFGVVMLEAGMCGTPTIGARLEGIEDVIAEGENGHLVESGNAQAFADAVGYYNRNRSALRDLRPRTASRTSQFAWKTVANRHVEIVRDVLKR